MPRVLGLDPGTVSLDCCGLVNGSIAAEWSLPTAEALAEPEQLISRLMEGGRPDLIAGPSGYGLPLIRGSELSEEQVHLAVLPDRRSPAGLGGLSRLMRLLAGSGLPVVFTPGVIHLHSVPPQRKLNRIDLGTADKVASAVAGVVDQSRRLGIEPARTSFILLELGGAFSAVIGVEHGRIVDGCGGTAGPMGWQSGGSWDGEVACLAGKVSKGDLFRGGVESALARGIPRAIVLEGYVESADKAVRQMTSSVAAPHEILLSGRHSADAEIRSLVIPRLERLAPVRPLAALGGSAKIGAQGAAIMADGLAGGRFRSVVEAMSLTECSGTTLDLLTVIDPAEARTRLQQP
jgi:predicted butyrate kinase (DUF1464 family)